MSVLNQLLLNFNHKQNFNYNDFYVSKSNFYAFQLIEKWPKWEKNILNIYGEKFSGKTHLINIFLNKNKGIKVNENDINEETFKKFKPLGMMNYKMVDNSTRNRRSYRGRNIAWYNFEKCKLRQLHVSVKPVSGQALARYTSPVCVYII